MNSVNTLLLSESAGILVDDFFTYGAYFNVKCFVLEKSVLTLKILLHYYPVHVVFSVAS